MEEPLTSIVLSSYNRPRLIQDALDSVLAQTWPNIEIVVADDHSDDPILVSYLDNLCHFYDERVVQRGGITIGYLRPIRVVRPPTVPSAAERQYGQRCAICINEAMRYVTGEFVAFLPDDDGLPPRSVEVRARYLMQHPEVNVVYGRLEACHAVRPSEGIHFAPSDQEQPIVREFPDGRVFRCVHDRNGFWSEKPLAAIENRVDHSMFMVRRVDSLPEWPADVDKGAYDCDDARFLMACRIAGLGPFHSIPDVVTVKRYHSMGHRTDPQKRE